MNEAFKELFNELLLTKEAKTEDQAAQVRRELWEELKYSLPFMRQIFTEVKRRHKYNSIPPLSLFVDIRNELKYKRFLNVEDNHYPKQPCGCPMCVQLKRLDDGVCMYCGAEEKFDAYVCYECHFKESGYVCRCATCTIRRKEAEVDKQGA